MSGNLWLVALREIGDSVATIKPGARFMADPREAQVRITAGDARLADDCRWDGLVWTGATVAILAGGESLSQAQIDETARWRAAADDGSRRVIAINNAYERAPWADILYSSDAPWWRVHYVKVQTSGFRGALWSCDVRAREFDGVTVVASRPYPRLGRFPGVIHQGGNGGYQALNLAYQAGARRVLLLGYDMIGGHWHGRHPSPLTNPTKPLFELWIRNFDAMAPDLASEGVRVLNCSERTKLTCFERMPLLDAMKLDDER